jgi:hypothetical protein
MGWHALILQWYVTSCGNSHDFRCFASLSAVAANCGSFRAFSALAAAFSPVHRISVVSFCSRPRCHFPSFDCAGCIWLANAVKGGERAIIFNRLVGIKEATFGEGTHLMLPWFDRPIIFEVRTRPRQIQSLTGSKGLCTTHLGRRCAVPEWFVSEPSSDLQMVQITLRVLTRPDPSKLPEVYRTLGLGASGISRFPCACVAQQQASLRRLRRESAAVYCE